ncbi:MAG TPA: peptidylprolyl isomerase [Planctomycetota bacterium]|nr:peptidylprolyl isomerase [Planctomycetota bacterium]
MKHIAAFVVALSLLSACGKQEALPPALTSAPGGSGASGARPEKLSNGEPSVITLKHVLIAFAGAKDSSQTRTRAEAEKLAFDVVNRAKGGEDFDKMMKDYSNDPGDGTYTLVNAGIQEAQGESRRDQMVPAFGNVGFRIGVGEVGLADYDPKSSPYGLHVIKRVK